MEATMQGTRENRRAVTTAITMAWTGTVAGVGGADWQSAAGLTAFLMLAVWRWV